MKKLKICPKGHRFYKSSDCNSCPKCESEVSTGNFLDYLAAPARRALQSEGIDTLEKLSKYSEKEILKLHGMGAKSIPVLKNYLEEKGLEFKK